MGKISFECPFGSFCHSTSWNITFQLGMRCVFAKSTKATRAFDSMCKTNRILIFFIALKRSSQFLIASIVHAELAITMCVPLTLQGIHLINSLIDEHSLPVVQAYMKYIQVCFQGPLQLAVT